MPAVYAPIPLPNRGSTTSNRTVFEPAFSASIRIALGVLSWLAFFIASYLAYSALTGTSVAGCGMGTEHGCDLVLSSAWSKWLGIPVAALGLACYASLASLSVLMWWRNEEANHWITTAFVLLAVVAAGASVWFICVQLLAIGHICWYCLATDTCGILIGSIATAATVHSYLTHRASPQPAALFSAGRMALRPGSPVASRTVPPSVAGSPPSLIALAGAVPLLAILIGGQLLFPGKTYMEAKVALASPIKLDDATDAATSSTATPRVALRVPPTETELDNTTANSANATDPQADKAAVEDSAANNARSKTGSNGNTKPTAQPADPPAAPPRVRILKLLGGKLELNAYQHPMIGSPDAPHIVVEMVSYDCVHCRKMHALMKEALSRYGDQVALLVMPIPFDMDCNKAVTDPAQSHRGACGTARRACAIARLEPTAFEKFHNFLMSGKDKPPALDRIIPKANTLVDRDQLRQLIEGPEIKKQIEGYIDLADKLQLGLPIQILGDKPISGSFEKPEDLYKAWEENLGVKPQ